MRVDESLEPTALVVHNLHDVCQGQRAVFLGEVLKLCGVTVVAASEELLRDGNRILEGKRRICRRDTS